MTSRRSRVAEAVRVEPCSCLFVLEQITTTTVEHQPRGLRGVQRLAIVTARTERVRKITCYPCELAILRRLCGRDRKGGPAIPTATKLPRIAHVVDDLAREVPIDREEIVELLGCGRTIDEILSMAEGEAE